MKRKTLLITVFVLLSLLRSFSIPITHDNNPKTLDILFVASHNDLWPWTLSLFTQCKYELEIRTGRKVNMLFESDNIPVLDEKDLDFYRKYYSTEEKASFEIIVAREYCPSLEILQKIFPEIPVFISSQVKPFLNKDSLIHSNTYIRHIDLQPVLSLNASLQCLPKTQKVIVITGIDPFDDQILTQLKVQLKQDRPEPELEIWQGIPPNIMMGKIKNLPKHSLILYLSFIEDNQFNKYVPLQVLKQIIKISPVPIFGIADTYIDNGIVGGYIHSAKSDGRETARIIHHWMEGNPIDNFRSTKDYGEMIFDWYELQKWKIKEHNIPENATVLYRPNKWINRHPRFLEFFLIAFGVVLISASGLIHLFRMKNRILMKEKMEDERFWLINEINPDAIFIAYSTGDFKLINKKGIELLGYTEEEFFQMNLKNLFISDQTDQKDWIIRLKCQGHLQSEEDLIHKNGNRISMDLNAIVLPNEDLYISCRDLKVRKEIERQLIRAKEKAEEADQLKSAFLANMSHEIRTPLNGILGFTYLLKQSKLSEEEKNSYLEIVKESGNRMLTTINDIIDLSKIDSGQMDLNYEEILPEKFLHYLYCFFQPEAKKKNIDLYLENSINPEKSFTTDKSKLNSILTNLIKNAIKFTSEGSITIRSKLTNHILEINVRDTGIGISEQYLSTIFNRFEQADVKKRYTSQEGSGLGLSISKSYAELMEGSIEVESELGKGSIFTLCIPDHKGT